MRAACPTSLTSREERNHERAASHGLPSKRHLVWRSPDCSDGPRIIYIYMREREERERESGGERERIWFTHAHAHAHAHSHLKTPPASACSFNDFKPEGATALAPALQQLTTLQKLILGSAASLLPSSSLEAPDSSVRGPPSRFLRFDHETGRLRGRVILRGESGLGSLGLPETWNTTTRRCGLYISPSI